MADYQNDDPIVLSDRDVSMDSDHPHHISRGTSVEHEAGIKSACREAVLSIFPDICPDHLEALAIQKGYDHEALITDILDQIERGKPVPKRQRVSLKRKRESGDVGDRLCDLKKKYDNPDWGQKRKHPKYVSTA